MSGRQIGTATVHGNKGRKSPVMCSHVYGVTCWEIGTTNGHLRTAADRFQQHWQAGSFTLELDGKPWDFEQGADALFEELARLWAAMAQAVQVGQQPQSSAHAGFGTIPGELSTRVQPTVTSPFVCANCWGSGIEHGVYSSYPCGVCVKPVAQAVQPDLTQLHANGAKAWADVPDATGWVDELRGGDEVQP